ncbi:MAG: hypothetical protein H7Z37_07195 [Pyrinomonadaceae bacterium]|nr:hypothetical protein [Pyrinomonadaceae bacterium]
MMPENAIIQKTMFKVLRFRFLPIAAAMLVFCFSTFAQKSESIVNANTKAVSAVSTVPEKLSTTGKIQNSESLRLKLFLDESRTIDLQGKIETAVILSPVIVKTEIVAENSIRITCLTLGETMIVASGAGKRFVIIIEVVSHPVQSEAEFNYLSRRTKSKTFGVYSIGVSPPSNLSPTFFRHTLSLRRNVTPTRVLRADIDFYNPLGTVGSQILLPFDSRFNLNRIELGLTEKDYSIDVLDSIVNLSRADLDNYLVRGFHYQKREESVLRRTRFPVEIFAGLARPATTFFSQREGFLFGAALPVYKTPKLLMRAGFITVIPKRRNGEINSGTAFRLDGKYEQTENDKYEFGLDFDTKKFSFYGKTDNKMRDFTFNGEVAIVADTSPFIKIGAQASARKAVNTSVYWKPRLPVFAFASYNRTKASSFAFASQSGSFDLSFFVSSFNYTPNARTRLNFSYVQQSLKVENPDFTNSVTNLEGRNATPALILTATNTKSFAFTYSQSFGRGFTNEFSIRPTFSSDPRSKAGLNNGFVVQEELRRSFSRFSVSAFANITRQTPSLESVVIANQNLLPPDLRREFNRNPAQFFIVYRDLLPTLIGNAPFLFARNVEGGIKTQGSFTKNSFIGELRYVKGDSFGQKQNNILASGGYVYRLDDANLIGVNASRLVSNVSNITGTSSLTFTYTYRFGGQNEKSFSPFQAFGLKKLFRFGKGEIAGRVFTDSNSNGLDDENETGLTNIEVVIDNGKSSTVTDVSGNYSFKNVPYGSHIVAVKLNELGIKIRASTQEEQTVFVEKRSPTKISFGFNNKGFVSGRVFNDSQFDGIGANAAGLPKVRLNVYQTDKNGTTKSENPQTRFTDANGKYDFYSLEPGDYVLEIDNATLPPNFRLPQKSHWQITVEPLRGNYFNVPVIAQRAIAGTIFADKDGDGVFDSQKDEPLEGIRVVAQITTAQNKTFTIKAISGKNGAYILRNLPAGSVDVQAFAPDNKPSSKKLIELTEEPTTRRGVNLSIQK